MDRKCRNKQERKESLAVSVACMAIYCPTPGFKERTFKLCVLNRWDFNCCIHSSPLWGIVERTNKEEIRLEELSEKTESCQANSWNERAIKTEIDTQEQK